MSIVPAGDVGVVEDHGPGAAEWSVLAWLLDGDPAVRWQVLRDLCGASTEVVAAERARVAVEGWGARLLAAQDADGRWAGGLYSPKWTSTTYTLLLLHRLGLSAGHPQASAGCQVLWDAARCYEGGLNLAVTVHEPETCITGMLVLLAAAFGGDRGRVVPTAQWLVGQQLADGGWNCDTIRRGSTHGSFHTSITVLEGLAAYRQSGGDVTVDMAIDRGRAFLLRHRLYRSHRTGAVVDPAYLRFPFPPQWRYDVVRGLEHLSAVGSPRDDRMRDAVDEVRRRQRSDGTWPVYRPHPGRRWFELEPTGTAGRWSTLRALRILRWWDAPVDQG